MKNRYDIGLSKDYDNMTLELGRTLVIQNRRPELDYGEQEDTNSDSDSDIKEIIFIQEMDSKHEAIASGVYKVGDVKMFFRSNSQVEEEAIIVDGDNRYKALEVTSVKGMSNNIPLYIKAFGKKIPGR